jgi:Zn-dependent metalloprotease
LNSKVKIIITVSIIMATSAVLLLNNSSQTMTEEFKSNIPNDASKISNNPKIKFKEHLDDPDKSSANNNSNRLKTDELAAIIQNKLENIQSQGDKLYSKLDKKTQIVIDELDLKYSATSPSEVITDSAGKIKAVYPRYSQSFSDAGQFVAAASTLLQLSTNSELVEQKSRCISEQCTTRFQRTIYGVPVLSDNVVVTLISGKITSVIGALSSPNITKAEVDNGDILTKADLLDIATKEIGEGFEVTDFSYGVYQKNGGATVAYSVKVEQGIEGYDLLISARTKSIIDIESHLKTATNAKGTDLAGNTYLFNAIPGQSGFIMQDSRFPVGSYTNVKNGRRISVGQFSITGDRSVFISSTSLTSGWDASGVSVLSHYDRLLTYFNNTFEYRFGESGSDIKTTEIFVNVNVPNAYFSGGSMYFGLTNQRNYAASFEIVGHELGHGMVDDLAGLRGHGWARALNESFADLWAVLASQDNNWLVGDDNGASLRNMAAPMFYKDYKIKNGEHYNAGISNRFFYLVAEGLSDLDLGQSIGREKLGKIAFTTLNALNFNSDFNLFYATMKNTASTLYGIVSAEVVAIENAGKAIGYIPIEEGSKVTIETTGSAFGEGGQNVTAFLSHNSLTQDYDLYLQIFNSNELAYDSTKVFKLASNAVGKAPALTAQIDSKGDEFLYLTYKGVDKSIYLVRYSFADGFSSSELLNSDLGQSVNSMALSSDGKYAALTQDGSVSEDNVILLVDIINKEFTALKPTTDSYTQGFNGVSVTQIDAIDFDPTNRKLTFDYQICSSESECYWSIGIYDLVSKEYSYPFASLSNKFSVGNPSFANVMPNYITFDAIQNATGYSLAYILNIESSKLTLVSVTRIEGVTAGNYSRPMFTQDDAAIVFSGRQSNLVQDGFLFSIRLEDYSPIADSWRYINVVNKAIHPVTVPLKTVDVTPSLQVDAITLEYGTISTNSAKEICLSNDTTYAININDFVAEEAVNTSSLDTYIAGGVKSCRPVKIDVNKLAFGDFSLQLNIKHNGKNSPTVISLTGRNEADFDGDGIPDFNDTDDDNDGVPDTSDVYPLIAIGRYIDTDNDGAPDDCDTGCISLGMRADTDDDNDGVLDGDDAFPLDATKFKASSNQAKTDFNGDGRSDIFWRNTLSGQNIIWQSDTFWHNPLPEQNIIWQLGGATNTSFNQDNAIHTLSDLSWEIVGQGDFNGDGTSDILWRNNINGRNSTWLFKEGKRTKTVKLDPVNSQSWKVAGVGDFDGDGTSDILWRNAVSGANIVWLMQDAVRSSKVDINPVGIATGYEVAAIADMNLDGIDDIIWRSSVNGRNSVWTMEEGNRKSRLNLDTVPSTAYVMAAVEDFNGDGSPDIFWRHEVSGVNILWLMQGTTKTSKINQKTVADLNWKIVGTGNYDGNAASDVLWRHQISGSPSLWFFDENGFSSRGKLPNVDFDPKNN